jgi:hypothetical protein
MGPYAKVDYNSLYLKIVNSVVSYPPLQSKRGDVEEDLPSFSLSLFALSVWRGGG